MIESLSLRWNEAGLIPAIVQDAESGQVLMMAWMNRLALQKTLESGQTHFWSRSRDELWHKGQTSSYTQQVIALWVDCDRDVLLVSVRARGPACHTGEVSCFHRKIPTEWVEGSSHERSRE